MMSGDLDYSEVREALETDGYFGPVPYFGPADLKPLQAAIMVEYEGDVDFPSNGSYIDTLEKAEVKVDPNNISKALFYPHLLEFSKSPNVRHIFENLLPGNIVVSKFIDFRISFANKPSRFLTGWHQDIETYYSDIDDEFGFQFFTMWIPLTRVTKSNSLEIVRFSHRSNIIYDTTFTNQTKSLHEIAPEFDRPGSIKTIECGPGDVVFLHPYVIHRSTPNQSGTNRFSIDIRYISEAKLAKPRVQGLYLRVRKVKNIIRSNLIRLLEYLGLKNMIKILMRLISRTFSTR
jgi:hypothetical protein